MIKKKIKLFFEDKVNSEKSYDQDFAHIFESFLENKYIISEEYGKVTLSKSKKTNKEYLCFAKTFERNEELQIPVFSTKETNQASSWDLHSRGLLKDDEMPFFVIDTDGISTENIQSRIFEIDSGNRISRSLPINYPVHGRPRLLTELISSSYHFNNFLQNWGLVLLNPNREIVEYDSIKTNLPDLDSKIFKSPDEYHLGISWIYKGHKTRKSFFKAYSKYETDSFEYKKDTQLKLIKDIWKSSSQIQDSFSKNISKDISYYYKEIINLMDKKYLSEDLSPKRNPTKNASKTLFSLYLRKGKECKNWRGQTYQVTNEDIVNKVIDISEKEIDILCIEFARN